MKILSREDTKGFFNSLVDFKQAAYDGQSLSNPVKDGMISKEAVEEAVRNEIGNGKVLVNTTGFWFIENTGEFFTWKGVATHVVNGNHKGLFGFNVVTAHGVVRGTEVYGLDLSEPPKPKELPAPKVAEKVKVQDEPSAPVTPKTTGGGSGGPSDLTFDGLFETVMAKIKPEQLAKIGGFIELFAGLMKPETAPAESTAEKEPVAFTDRPPVTILGSDESTLTTVVPVVEEVESEPEVEKPVPNKVAKKQPKTPTKVKVQDEPPKTKNLDSSRKSWKKSFKDLTVA